MSQPNTVQHLDDDKGDIEHIERGHEAVSVDDDLKHAPLEERVQLTEAENTMLRRKTDKRILSVLILVYFLQVLDKNNIGYANILGLSKDLNLKGTQYSLLASMLPFAQIAWMPFSSYLIVRVPSRYLMTFFVFFWGAMEAIHGAGTSLGALMALRFLLGIFESGCLPLFSVMTAQWYRRSEQPLRIAMWYCMNGVASIVGAAISYGLSFAPTHQIYQWQALFILCGLLTVLAAVVVWMLIDSNVESARFLTEDEKLKTVERLRANQTGIGSNKFKWDQALEALYDPKTILFVGLSLLVNSGIAVGSKFGPTLIAGMGFDKQISNLLNMPYGALQVIVILFSSWAAQTMKSKCIPLAILQIPGIIGCALLYTSDAEGGTFKQGQGLAGYYLLAFNSGSNPLLVSWITANTAGQTKKSVLMALFQIFSGTGNVIGPMLFNANDAPYYKPGVRACLGIFVAQLAVVGMQVVVIYALNRIRRRQRVAAGKPEFIKDTSMNMKYEAFGEEDRHVGEHAVDDITDYKNNEFVYVY